MPDLLQFILLKGGTPKSLYSSDFPKPAGYIGIGLVIVLTIIYFRCKNKK